MLLDYTLHKITAFDELKTHMAYFARLRGVYYVWNLQARYEHDPDLYDQKAKRLGASYLVNLTRFERIRDTATFDSQRLDRLRQEFSTGQWLLLLYVDKTLTGCVRLKYISPKVARLHSLYVTDQYRGHGFGSVLLDRIITVARQQNFHVIHLETLPFMKAARQLYTQKRFQRSQDIDFGHLDTDFDKTHGIIYMILQLD